MSRRSGTRKTSRKRYSDEYRAEALKLAERVGVKAAAAQLGLHESQLYGWRARARQRTDQGELERQQAAEVARLKRQLADQVEELAILKKGSIRNSQRL